MSEDAEAQKTNPIRRYYNDNGGDVFFGLLFIPVFTVLAVLQFCVVYSSSSSPPQSHLADLSVTALNRNRTSDMSTSRSKSSPAHIQAPLWPAFLVLFAIAHFMFWCLWSFWTWTYSTPEGFRRLLHSTIFVKCMAGGVWLFAYINYTTSYAGQDAPSFLALWACSAAVVDVA
ncbi:hypothetical protein LTS18_014830, partial [Coniosporium uncinatum]